MKGELFLNSKKTIILHSAGLSTPSRVHTDHTDPSLLSRREKEVLELIADGLTNKEIGTRLFISALTVKTHRKNCMVKLHAKNAAGLVKLALINNLIS